MRWFWENRYKEQVRRLEEDIKYTKRWNHMSILGSEGWEVVYYNEREVILFPPKRIGRYLDATDYPQSFTIKEAAFLQNVLKKD